MNEGRHIALIIEDDRLTAEQLALLLRSIGHDSVIATTAEQARQLMLDDHFCYVLADQQIPRDGETNAHVETGREQLEWSRRRYRGKNANDEYVVQIVAMSEHLQTAAAGANTIVAGGTLYIAKPYRDDEIIAKVKEALRKAGRERHDEYCASATAAARSERDGGSATNGKIILGVKGTKVKRRSHILINGNPVAMKPQTFLMMLRLIRTRLEGRDEYIMVHELVPGTIGHKPVSRVMEDLAAVLAIMGPELKIYDNDNEGGYRLHPDVELGEIDFETLERHSPMVKALAKEIRELQRKR